MKVRVVLIIGALLVPGAAFAAAVNLSDWQRLAGDSTAVVTAMVEEPIFLVERPDKRGETVRLQPGGTTVVEIPSSRDYIVGRVVRMHVEDVVKADGRMEVGGTIEVFLEGAAAAFQVGERYLLFLQAPIRLSRLANVADGWRSLMGTTLVRPGTEEIPFDPLSAYGLSATPLNSSASAVLLLTAENQPDVSEIIRVLKAGSAPNVTMTSPNAGALIKGMAEISALATDDVGVAGVQFILDGGNLGAELEPAPSGLFKTQWDTKLAADGPHSLRAVARDEVGNSTTSTAVGVTVDNTAPTLHIAAHPSVLRHPDGDLERVRIQVTVSDAVSPHPVIRLVSIECDDEPDPTNKKQQKHSCDPRDIKGAAFGNDDREFKLRAERAGKQFERIYTITYSATDAAGNTSMATTTVQVPKKKEHHDPRKRHRDREHDDKD